MADKVLTAPLAVIKVNNVRVGKMKGIRINESLQRGRVSGIGSLTPDELPAIMWSGTLSCDFYNIDFSKSQLPGAMNRNFTSLSDWQDNVCLQDEGVTVDIYKTVTDTVDANGVIKSKLVKYSTIIGNFLDGENFDISEGQISGRSQSFQYLNPILFTV